MNVEGEMALGESQLGGKELEGECSKLIAGEEYWLREAEHEEIVESMYRLVESVGEGFHSLGLEKA